MAISLGIYPIFRPTHIMCCAPIDNDNVFTITGSQVFIKMPHGLNNSMSVGKRMPCSPAMTGNGV